MSSKIGTILSMLFVVLFFLFGVDLVSLQCLYSELDSKGISIAYKISKEARIDRDFLDILEKKYEVEITTNIIGTVSYGDSVEFVVKDTFDPLVISNKAMVVSINREAIIGYYG